MHYLASLFIGIFAFLAPHHPAPTPVPAPIVQATTTIPVPVKQTIAPKKKIIVPAAAIAAPVAPVQPQMSAAQFKALMDRVNAVTAPAPLPDYTNQIIQQQAQERADINAQAAQTRAVVDASINCESKIQDAENQIKAEIQAAGGFGTESQVRAMAMGRVSC